ncbi:hypothetical protein Ancab_019285 [Ancistrocladus abbreviatus]
MAFYICMIMKEPSDKHQPNPAFLAKGSLDLQRKLVPPTFMISKSRICPFLKGKVASKEGCQRDCRTSQVADASFDGSYIEMGKCNCLIFIFFMHCLDFDVLYCCKAQLV